MLKLTKRNVECLWTMYNEYQFSDDRQYSSIIDMFEDFIMWKLGDEERERDVHSSWLKYCQRNRLLPHQVGWQQLEDFLCIQSVWYRQQPAHKHFLVYTGE